MTSELDKKKLIETMNNMEKIVSVHKPLEKAKSVTESVIKGLDAAGSALSAIPVWGNTAKAICSGVSKLLKIAIGVTTNQEMCLYLSNRILFLHTSSTKIFLSSEKKKKKNNQKDNDDDDDDEDTAIAVERILSEMKKIIDQSQKLIEPYAPRLDEQDPTKTGNAKKFAQFLAKVYHNVCDSMDREKFEEVNKKIDRISQDTTLLFVVSSNNNNDRVPSMPAEQVKNLWKQSEKEITDKVKQAVAQGNEEVKSVLGSISSQIDELSGKVQNMQDMMCSAFATLLKNKDFESCKWKGEVSRLVIDKSTILGSGGSGVVYAALLGGSEKLAAKRLFVTEGEDPQISARAILRECRRLQDAVHPNVVTTFGLIVQKPDTYLIQERCVTTLDNLVQTLGKEFLPESVRLFYCLSLAKVYSHLHQLGMVMGDIKQSNVLIKSSGKCCVSDFGSVKGLSTLTASPSAQAQAEADLGITPAYAAPELSETLTTTYQSDVFAFGAMVFETLTGKQFYKSHTAITLDQTVPNKAIRRLLSRCLSSSPLDRPTMSAIDVNLEDIIADLSSSTSVEEETLFSVVQTYKKKAASDSSSSHFDPNTVTTPHSPLSPFSGGGSSFFPYWMSALPISDENKRILLDNEFDTIDTLASLTTEDDFESMKLPVGARKKILQAIPEIRPGVVAFESVNPDYEKQTVMIQREEQEEFKTMMTLIESILAVETLSRSAENAYQEIVAEFEEDSDALSKHVERVSKLSPILQTRLQQLAEVKQTTETGKAALEEIKTAFNAETEKAVATKLSEEELKNRLGPWREEFESNIVKVNPSLLSGVTNIADAKKKIQDRIDEHNNNLLPDLSKKLSEVEVQFSRAKADSSGNRVGKYKLTEADGWQKDADAPTCNHCKEEFSLFNRRHHCRAECGLVFCGKCSANTLPYNGQQIRCCDACFSKVNAADKLATHLPQLESNFKEASAALNNAKKTLKELEKTCLPALDKLQDQLKEKESQIRFADMASNNKPLFEKYFAAEEKYNNSICRGHSLQIEIDALNVLLDPLQKVPEKLLMQCPKHELILSKAKRCHFVALVNASTEERQAASPLLDLADNDEELFNNTAVINVEFTWTLVFNRRKADSKVNKQDPVPPIEGVAPAHLAALCGCELFFSDILSKSSRSGNLDQTIFVKTVDERTPASFAAMLGHANVVKFLLDKGLPSDSHSQSGLGAQHWFTFCGSRSGLKLVLDAGFDFDLVTEKNGLSCIHIAAYVNRAGCADHLLSAGCTVGRTKTKNSSPLHAACLTDARETAKVILASGKADINEIQDDGCTPLIFCAQQGNLEIVKLFVSVGAEIERKSNHGYTAFHAACHFGKTAVVDWMLKNVKGLNACPRAGESELTPIHNAAKEGHVDIIKLLLEVAKVDKDERDKAGRNAVARACMGKQPASIKYLLQMGADPELKYTDGTEFRPIHSAVNSGSLETLKALVENAPLFGKKKTLNIDPRTKTRSTPLFLASRLSGDNQQESLAIAKYLIDKGADVDCVNQYQYAMLHSCAEFGNLPLFRYLVEEKKLNYECVSSAGTTVLTAAASEGHEHIIEYCLENLTINREAAKKNGNTAIICAALNRHSGCVRKLIEFGADVNKKNDSGWNAFLAACGAADYESAKNLAAANADQTVKTKLGNTALHLACTNDKENLADEAADIVKFLLADEEKIANVTFFRDAARGKGENDRNALSIAAERGNVAIMKMLLKVKNCDVNNVSKVNKATPLIFISHFSNEKAVEGARLLISHGANKEAVTDDGRTALMTAAISNFPVVKLLISSGANKTTKDPRGWNALHYACSRNQKDTVKYLTTSITGFDVNEGTKSKTPPIGLAILENGYEVVEYLLDAHQDEYIKLDFEAIDSEGRNLLHLACWPKGSKCSAKLVKLLLDHDATKNASWRNCDAPLKSDVQGLPIHLAAEGTSDANKREVFDLICERTPAGLHDKPDGRGCTPAYCALTGGFFTTLQKLHENYNVDMNAVSSFSGNSLLNCAVQMPLFSLQATQYLIDHGAKVDYVNPKTQRDILHHAILYGGNGAVSTVKFLLKQPGVSISSRDGLGATVLFRAAETGKKELVQFLLEQPGIDLNTPTTVESNTPLHMAASKGFTEVCEILLKAGCLKTAVNKNGKTPFDIATGAKHTAAAAVLKV